MISPDSAATQQRTRCANCEWIGVPRETMPYCRVCRELLTPPGTVRQRRRPDPRSLLVQAETYTSAQDNAADLEARETGSWSNAIDSAWTRRFLELEAEIASWHDDDAMDDLELPERNEMRGLYKRERERLLARLASGDLRADPTFLAALPAHDEDPDASPDERAPTAVGEPTTADIAGQAIAKTRVTPKGPRSDAYYADLVVKAMDLVDERRWPKDEEHLLQALAKVRGKTKPMSAANWRKWVKERPAVVKAMKARPIWNDLVRFRDTS